MPYIKKADRVSLNKYPLATETPGELNYVLTRMIMAYRDTHPKTYQTINDIIGALEGAKLEFYRRISAPYEDTKIQENGDVY
jgi:hypothetical protein